MKLLIVDDEPLARRHIRNAFPWKEWGYTIIGEAANGSEALSFCERELPDITLVDITMPVMDGLAFVEKLKSTYPMVQAVILTAHRDFGFAQKAIRLGASGYILKSPINFEETKVAMDRARSELEKMKTYENREISQQELLSNYRYPMRKKFWEYITSGTLSEREEIIKHAETIGVRLDADSYLLFDCRIDNLPDFLRRYPAQEHHLVKFSFLEIVREVLSASFSVHAELLPVTFGAFVIVLALKADEDGYRSNETISLTAASFLERLNDTLGQLLKISVSMAASDLFSPLHQMRSRAFKLIEAHEHRYYQKTAQPVWSRHTPPFTPFKEAEALHYGNLFAAAIRSEEADQLDIWENQTAQFVMHYKFKPDAVKNWLSTLMKDAAQLWNGHGQPLPELPGLEHSVSLFDSLRKVRKWAADCREFRDKAVLVRSDIARVIHYIQKHLNEDLNVDSIAREVQLSTAYLGRLFKKDIGMTINDYIMNQRIQLAQKYMRENTFRNYELAEKVGFNSYSYFCTVFKKITGKTPNEYKNAVKTYLS